MWRLKTLMIAAPIAAGLLAAPAAHAEWRGHGGYGHSYGHYAGGWRATYVVTSVIALWFNVFVFIVQSFQKVPPLHVLAPTGTETPFKVSQLVVLITFIVLGVRAVRKFHPA